MKAIIAFLWASIALLSSRIIWGMSPLQAIPVKSEHKLLSRAGGSDISPACIG